MSERDSAEVNNDLAAAWVSRFDRGLAADEEMELRAWLAGDDRRAGAFARAQAVWHSLDRVSVFGAGGHPDTVLQTRRRVKRTHLLAIAGPLAAGLGVLLIGGQLLPALFNSEQITTRLGEVRSVPLADGSVVVANTNSSIKVDLDKKLRSVALAQGEAWFKVAHDRSRPFLVKAGAIRIRAVGTSFSVRLKETETEVLVTEGSVEVWNEWNAALRRTVTAGRLIQADIHRDLPSPVEASDEIDRDLSWRTGQLVFDGDTVAAAADEFNRYNSVKIRVSGQRLRQKRLVGRFQMNEPESFGETVAEMLDGQVRQSKNSIDLSGS